DLPSVAAKIDEEVAEFTAAVKAGDTAQIEAEFGDVLFTLVNVARHAGIDADNALRRTNATFAARVRRMEAIAKTRGLDVETLDLDAWDRLWDDAKAAESAAA
ncbi:MAG: MazG nucleotide pyrophosphohydrolase domain-containing protein, partial [Pseudomonadota bacterium]